MVNRSVYHVQQGNTLKSCMTYIQNNKWMEINIISKMMVAIYMEVQLALKQQIISRSIWTPKKSSEFWSWFECRPEKFCCRFRRTLSFYLAFSDSKNSRYDRYVANKICTCSCKTFNRSSSLLVGLCDFLYEGYYDVTLRHFEQFNIWRLNWILILYVSPSNYCSGCISWLISMSFLVEAGLHTLRASENFWEIL